jgi:tetratricopeptide (TPR) repeat protein
MGQKDWERYLQDPRLPQGAKDDFQERLSSSITQGQRYEALGYLELALNEYQKENDRPIRSAIDAEIRQQSFCHVGDIYRKLGEIGKAILAYQEAMGLYNRYSLGHPTYEELAEVYLEQGEVEEAIKMCELGLERSPSWGLKQLLNKARSLLEG